MDAVSDMGGMHGFGPVVGPEGPEADEPPFHERWEGRVHGMVLAATVAGIGLPYGRDFIERLPAAQYLSSSYYERWLSAFEERLVAAGLVTADELAAASARPVPASRTGPSPTGSADPALADRVRSILRPFPRRDTDQPAHRWAPGDRVRVRRMHPARHCRCPRYVRGVAGTIAARRSPQPLLDRVPDGERVVEPQYSVAFDPGDLWGADAEPGRASVIVDLWESHLEAAGPG